MPAEAGLCTTVELPDVALGNLAEVVGFELDRYTPFRADQVYFACRVLRHDRAEKRIVVEVTVVPHQIVDAAIGEVAALGVGPDEVEIAGTTAQSGSPHLILDRPARASRRGDLLTYTLATAAAVLAAIAVAIPATETQRTAARLSEQLEHVKRSAAATAALRQEIAALREEEGTLVDRKRQSPAASKMLLDLTRALPDDTYLTDLQFVGSELVLAGSTASASELVATLELSGTFRNTAFVSAVTRDAKTGRERFSISTEVLPERQP
jgi:general secretion pathway protein L